MRGFHGGSGGASDATGPDGPDRRLDLDSPADSSADAADIQALLLGLSRLRLSISADLSAAAGALEAERPDIASDVVSGAAEDVADLQHAAWRRELQRELSQQLVASGVGDRGGQSLTNVTPPTVTASLATPAPHRRLPQPLRRPGKLLAGVLTLALAIIAAPHLSPTGSKPPSTPPQAAAPAINRTVGLSLVSAEFTALRTTLQGPRSTPAAVVAAGQKWQSTLSDSLVAASSSPAAARQIVSMLRLERTVIFTSPRLRTPEFSAATTMLTTNSDTLFGTLRALATAPVRAALPAAITALPTLGSETPTSPESGTGSTTGTAAGSSAGTSPAGPAPAPSSPPDPTVPAGSGAGTGTGTGTAPDPGTGTGTGSTPPQIGPDPVPVTPAPALPLSQLPKVQLPPLLGTLGESLLPGTNPTAPAASSTDTTSSSTSSSTSSTASNGQSDGLVDNVGSVLTGLGLGG